MLRPTVGTEPGPPAQQAPFIIPLSLGLVDEDEVVVKQGKLYF